MILRLVLGIMILAPGTEALACGPRPPFSPVGISFSRVVIGSVKTVVFENGGMVARVHVAKVVAGLQRPPEIELTLSPFFDPCNARFQTVSKSDERAVSVHDKVVVYFNRESGHDLAAYWVPLEWAVENDPALARAVPEVVREIALKKVMKDGGAAPRGDSRSWVTDDDYPTAALLARAEGLVRAQMSVDQNGKVIGCKIIRSSGNALLDEATCRNLTRRGRFKPPRLMEQTISMYERRWTIPTD